MRCSTVENLRVYHNAAVMSRRLARGHIQCLSERKRTRKSAVMIRRRHSLDAMRALKKELPAMAKSKCQRKSSTIDTLSDDFDGELRCLFESFLSVLTLKIVAEAAGGSCEDLNRGKHDGKWWCRKKQTQRASALTTIWMEVSCCVFFRSLDKRSNMRAALNYHIITC